MEQLPLIEKRIATTLSKAVDEAIMLFHDGKCEDATWLLRKLGFLDSDINRMLQNGKSRIRKSEKRSENSISDAVDYAVALFNTGKDDDAVWSLHQLGFTDDEIYRILQQPGKARRSHSRIHLKCANR
jgi:Holliday junction resolvasome RuvABC DNA-binding subunit